MWIRFFCLCLALAAVNVQGNELDEVLAGAHRTPAYAARDSYRHPLETLSFFDVQATMSVVEIWPGGGWYSEILAPYLKDKGVLYAAHFPTNNEIEFYQRSRQKFMTKLKAQPTVYGSVHLTELGSNSDKPIAPDAQADRVLTFRNVHNWVKGGIERNVFKQFYRALKPGGVLGVVEHRAKMGASLKEMAASGYVTESYVIELAEAAGFILEAKSEINANPKDSTVHPKGVWSLPPSLRLGEVEREKYLAIGESDRMTLKFVKPLPLQ